MKKIFFLFSFLFLLATGNLSAQMWTQLGNDINGEAVNDESGISIALSTDGKRMAIGAWSNDGNGTNAGHVRVYVESGGVWTQLGSDINGEAELDQSGISVSLSADGKRLAIGAFRNSGNGTLAGHVRVYAESAGAWTKVGGDIDGEAVDNWSGYAVSLSADGRRVAIGAFKNDDNGNEAGHVRVYKQTGSNWTKVGGDIDGEAAGDWSGLRVSLSADGKRLAIGAKNNDGNGTDAGHVRVYSESGSTWTQMGMDIDGEAAGDHFENVSLSADGKRLAIGAADNDGNGTNAGHVRVYSESGGTWTQLGGDIEGEAAGDNFGIYTSLSTDGKRLAIGAHLNDGNGTDAGHVRVFSENGGVWSQVGADIDGEAAGDLSGFSIALSANGQRVAIGAYSNDGSGINAGHARIYEEVSCDADSDGYDNVACGGSDCNDNNALINPGATEVCNGVDEDCDNLIDEGTADSDGDNICDSMDNCPTVPNSNQADTDGDGIGDTCDSCPNDPNNDADGDGICGNMDNCPSNANASQVDSDCDSVGDACDVCPDGDDRVDNNSDGIPDCNQLINYTNYASVWKCGTNKIYVCHNDATQCISKNQLSTHYNHGDDIGPCISCGGQNMVMPDIIHTSEDNDADGLTIFPNPAGNDVKFQWQGMKEEEALVTLFDYSGKIISQTIIEKGLHELRLDLSGSTFVSGFYFVKVSSGSDVQAKRFVILK